jgi:hypothetical protein
MAKKPDTTVHISVHMDSDDPTIVHAGAAMMGLDVPDPLNVLATHDETGDDHPFRMILLELGAVPYRQARRHGEATINSNGDIPIGPITMQCAFDEDPARF